MTKAHSPAAKPTHRVVTIDPKFGPGGLRFIGGSASDDFNHVLADQTMKTAWTGNSTDPNWTAQIHQASADALKGIAPKDEVEGMLAAQMVATHNAAMECFRRAMVPEQTFAGREMALTQANKLTRSYATLVQALDKHRGKGQQKVTVEHVHVHSGGQAAIGSFTNGAPGMQEAVAEAAVPRIGHFVEPPLDFATNAPEESFVDAQRQGEGQEQG